MAEAKAEVPSVEAESEGSFTIAEHSELLEAFYQIPSIEKAWLFPSKSGMYYVLLNSAQAHSFELSFLWSLFACLKIHV